ncbi:histidine phosphatase family protein [Salipiger bermudensis]|uniref:histidine phosphatase family protein n=1 Tax=Salipiger bermudensis TaxID=344736 RepID=UPI001C9A2007|nr:histidine phosphatase family protein [Salipiger bermudensis]MBY6003774.1 histidine phosphatase family protein [Salipiger bermudensis]
MRPPETNELLLIRHAPADHGGRLCGRTDVPALLPEEDVMAPLRGWLAGCSRLVSSPAQRCVQTAEALFPKRAVAVDERLWEQDFGAHDGLRFSELPDLGVMDRETLAAHCPPGGESFAAMAARVSPALMALAQEARAGGPVAVVAHAGTARAALGLALDLPSAGLGFEIAPLSVTRLRCHADGLSIIATNWAGPGA